VKRILREYWVEFLALLVAALGVFLVVKEFSIREVLRLAYHNAIAHLGSWAQSASTSAHNSIANFSTSDLLGGVLVLAGLAFIIWRGRYHFYRSEYWKAVNCPKCGGTLHRIHRTAWDRFLSRTLLLGARRYQCKNPECGWSGLRQKRDEDRRRERHETPETI
jgi:predicted RNA-binding Zn-ribbon protein involved in translation (DUF1610 family)